MSTGRPRSRRRRELLVVLMLVFFCHAMHSLRVPFPDGRVPEQVTPTALDAQGILLRGFLRWWWGVAGVFLVGLVSLNGRGTADETIRRQGMFRCRGLDVFLARRVCPGLLSAPDFQALPRTAASTCCFGGVARGVATAVRYARCARNALSPIQDPLAGGLTTHRASWSMHGSLAETPLTSPRGKASRSTASLVTENAAFVRIVLESLLPRTVLPEHFDPAGEVRRDDDIPTTMLRSRCEAW